MRPRMAGDLRIGLNQTSKMSPPPVPSTGPFFEGPCGNVLAAMHEAVLVIDEAQKIVAINPAAERLFDCPADELLGGSLARFIPPPYRDAHAALVRAFAAEQTPTRAMAAGRRVPMLRSDGSTRPVEIALSRFQLAESGGHRTYYAALLRDMGDERDLEDQLAALQLRMRAVFELSPIAIWICEDDRLAYANRATARLFGTPTIDRLIGRSLSSLLDGESHTALRLEIERALAGTEPGAIVSGRLTRADGEQREIEIALAALPDHGRTTVQMVVNDVTARHREALDMKRSRRALRALSASVVEAREEERRRIARELHDELGQRLTALKIDLSNLAATAKLDPEDARVSSMSAMLDDTLASVRRIASDLRPSMLDDLGLNAAIEWLARDASRRMGIPVQTQLPPTEPVVDQRVAIALYRMVQEALTNVARHAKARTVDIRLRRQGASLRLAVSDDGVGLDAAETAPTRRGAVGLIGLRERAHMLGGEVTIGPRPGGGTRVSVRLPIQPTEFADTEG
jgi:two-component system, NarL family, sensor histidine kinase UhpB